MQRFWKNQRGATSIEYGLIAIIVAVAAIAGLSLLGTAMRDQYYVAIAQRFASF